MAIAFDKQGSTYNSGTGTTTTVNMITSGSNRIAFVSCVTGTGTDPLATNALTVGGSAGTFVNKWNLSGAQWEYLFMFVNPPTAATDYVITAPNNTDVDMQVVTYNGAKQTGQPDSSNTGTTTGNLTLSTTVVASNCWLVSMARNTSAGVPTAGTGTTDRVVTQTYQATGDSNGTVGTGSQSMGWNAATGTTAGIIASIAPAAAAATSIPSLLLTGVGV